MCDTRCREKYRPQCLPSDDVDELPWSGESTVAAADPLYLARGSLEGGESDSNGCTGAAPGLSK